MNLRICSWLIPYDKCDNVSKSDIYMGISLSSAINMINGIIVLTKYKTMISNSDMQFGFKNK